MNQTAIYTTRKLEKIVSKFISKNEQKINEGLGEWVANLFFLRRKKCWIMINKPTKYLLILPNIKKTDLINISQIFKNNFYSQLIFDGIVIDYELVKKIVGEVELHETNDDKSLQASLNSSLLLIENFKNKDDSMSFRDLNNKLNSMPNKMLGWISPKEKMAQLIKFYN